MKISAAQAYCILDTVGSSILTKSGEISVSYLLELPEAYSLDRSDLEERHNELFRAFQYVRTGFIHKQDVFLRRKFKPEYVIEGRAIYRRPKGSISTDGNTCITSAYCPYAFGTAKP